MGRTTYVSRTEQDEVKPLDFALLSLEGLSVGDALGAALGEGKTSPKASQLIRNREVPPGPWEWTDDTHMSLSIVEVLTEYGEIDQDALAGLFSERFAEDPFRGYGRGAGDLLSRLGAGDSWRELSPRLFDGGSYGNGAACLLYTSDAADK